MRQGYNTKPRKTSQAPADDDALLTSAQVRARIGNVSNMCLWRWTRDERVMFPAPHKLNSRNYWRLGDLRRWQAERVTVQRPKASSILAPQDAAP